MSKAYKLFKIKNGRLYPLYILTDKEVPMNVWIKAENGELLENGKVKSKLGQLCYRPGWHLADIPYAAHIGQKDDNGNLLQKPDTVWCEVEYSDSIDYQPIANENGTNKEGKVIPVKSYLKEIPVNGYYRYKTSPLMFEDWIIAGSIKVNKILTNDEVDSICRANGIEPQKRAV
jgi:hypothetical protein